MSILADYKISFGVEKIHGINYKYMMSNEFILSNLISQFDTVIKGEELIKAIKYIEDHPEGSISFITDGLQFVEIFSLVTKIYTDKDNYHDQNSIPDLALPTNDFKEIVEIWRNFVVSGNPLLT